VRMNTDWSLFIKGVVLGFSIAAPVGPIGILCIRRTLQYGRFAGFFSGLGAATADTIYACIAAFGLTFISNFLVAWQFWLHLVGGMFLLYLGWKTFCVKAGERTKEIAHTSLLGDFVSTFFLTLTNPLTILSFLAIFAALGISSSENSYLEAFALILGVFFGSGVWWLILCEGVTLFRKKVSEKVMRWINRCAGMTIIGFGIAVLISISLSFIP
jgi:threonine/homoserine/homoserine lactone efflux protein